MREKAVARSGMDEDWGVIVRHLPEGWEEKAHELGAMRRSRGFCSPEVLLRTLMVHLAQGCSLRETAVRAKQGGLASVSDVAILKRLRASAEWLRWICVGLLPSGAWGGAETAGLRARAVDATGVSEPGSTGTNWRLHFSVDLKSLACDHFEITGPKGGETLRRIPAAPGDLLIADRAYCGAEGIRNVLGSGGQVLVRFRLNGFPLSTPSGSEFDVLARSRSLGEGEVREWSVSVQDTTSQGRAPILGRLCAIRRSRTAALDAERRLRRERLRKGRSPAPQALEAAQFVFLFTTVPTTLLSCLEICELYRARWQIEVAFRRLKSIVSLGHLPKYDPESCKAWLHGKLLVALLTERLLESARAFSPWGYAMP